MNKCNILFEIFGIFQCSFYYWYFPMDILMFKNQAILNANEKNYVNESLKLKKKINLISPEKKKSVLRISFLKEWNKQHIFSSYTHLQAQHICQIPDTHLSFSAPLALVYNHLRDFTDGTVSLSGLLQIPHPLLTVLPCSAFSCATVDWFHQLFYTAWASPKNWGTWTLPPLLLWISVSSKA